MVSGSAADEFSAVASLGSPGLERCEERGGLGARANYAAAGRPASPLTGRVLTSGEMATHGNAEIGYAISREKNSPLVIGTNGKKQKSRLENILFKLKKPDTDEEPVLTKSSDHQTPRLDVSQGNDELSNGSNSPSVSIDIKNGADSGSPVPNRRSTRKPSRRERGSTQLENSMNEDVKKDHYAKQKDSVCDTYVRNEASSPETDAAIMKETYGKSTKSLDFENIQIKIEKDDAQEYQCVFSDTPQANLSAQPEANISCEAETYPCEKCGEMFQSFQSLSKHMNSHTVKHEMHQSTVYPCCICGKSFSSQEYLAQHFVTHGTDAGLSEEEEEKVKMEEVDGEEQNGVYKCSHCRRVFSTDDDFQLHKCSKGLVKPYGCGRCGRCFTHLSTLTSHMALHKDGLAQDLECYECGQRFMYSIELRRHVNVHIKANFTPVSIRKNSVKSTATSTSTSVLEGDKSSLSSQTDATAVKVLSKHLKLKVNETRKPLKLKLPLSRFAPAKRLTKRGPPKAHACEICGKVFYQRSYLSMHMKIHKEKQYECFSCDKKFTFKKSLEIHMRIHTGERPYHCDFCNKDFTRQDSLQKHQKLHLGVKPYVCETCGRQFADKFELQRHGLSHLEEKASQMHSLQQSLHRQKRLKEHMFHHSGTLPFICELCGKGFARKYRYNQHLRQHAGEVRYTCEVCNKGFFSTLDLNYHLQTHSGKRPFKCDICGIGFLRESYLRRHMIVHSAVKPHKCSICVKEFARKSTLDRHILMHKRKDKEEELAKMDMKYNSLATDFGYGITGDVAPLSVSKDEERDIIKDIQAVIGLDDDVNMFE